MNTPINYQREKIKKYFNLLVEEFITDPRHKEDISIVFKQRFDERLKLGETEQSGGGSKTQEKTTWTTINGVKVPGSEKITTNTTYLPYKYVISFLNNYKNEDELRGTVVHEFTHLYLYSKIGDHDHDDRFYSQMESLESWLDKNQGLSPRLDKSHDRDQYVGDNNSNTKDKENTCPECSYVSPHHSPQCSHNQSNSRPTKNTIDPQKAAEFNLLKNSLEDSKKLDDLEKNYQAVKGNPLYSGKVLSKNNKGNWNDNKSILDSSYQMQKWRLQSHNDNQPSLTDNSKNGGGQSSSVFLIICLAGVVIILIGMVGYLVGKKPKYKPNQKKY